MPSLKTELWSVTLDGHLHWSVSFVKLGPPPFCGKKIVQQNHREDVLFVTFAKHKFTVAVEPAFCRSARSSSNRSQANFLYKYCINCLVNAATGHN